MTKPSSHQPRTLSIKSLLSDSNAKHSAILECMCWQESNHVPWLRDHRKCVQISSVLIVLCARLYFPPFCYFIMDITPIFNISQETNVQVLAFIKITLKFKKLKKKKIELFPELSLAFYYKISYRSGPDSTFSSLFL